MKENIVIYARVSTERQNHDTQLAELREYCSRRGWTVAEEIVDTVETFIINPKYVEDTKLMSRVGLTLGKIPGMPADFIQKQEAHRTTVVSDESLAEVFAKPTDKVAELLRIVGVIALKPKLDSTNLVEVMELIRDLVADEVE